MGPPRMAVQKEMVLYFPQSAQNNKYYEQVTKSFGIVIATKKFLAPGIFGKVLHWQLLMPLLQESLHTSEYFLDFLPSLFHPPIITRSPPATVTSS